MSYRQAVLLFAAVIFVIAPALHAQSAPPPDAYTVVQTNSMFGPSMHLQIYRDGSKVLLDTSNDPASGGKALHVRTLYDLAAGRTFSWDLLNEGTPCGSGTFSGDWGDPFAMSKEITDDLTKQQVKEVGSATVNGIPTKVFESGSPPGKARVWVDSRYGLVVRLMLPQSTAPPQTMIDVSHFVVGKPEASLFALPAVCAKAATLPRTPTEAEKIAALTGEDSSNFANAIMPPASKNACTAVFKVVRAGSMQPIDGGFQVAVDTHVDLDHPAHYVMGMSTNGRTTFSGGGLHEITGQMRAGAVRIADVPPQFNMELAFGKPGAASALIYRQCFGPETTLLMVVKNPEKLSDGAEWLWVKSGKFAAGAK